MTGARYEIRSTQGPSRHWDEMTQVGSSDSMGEALAMMLRALHGGAHYACQLDTRPNEPKPVTEAERLALAEIAPKMPRTMK